MVDFTIYRLHRSLTILHASTICCINQEVIMKKVLGVYSAPRPHWVGDGFPVRSLFSYQTHGKQLSPFLLLDYAGPADFAPSRQGHAASVSIPHRGS